MTDWAAIESELALAALDHPEPVKVASPLERAARLSEPVPGRCPHGFELGRGICGVVGCEGGKRS